MRYEFKAKREAPLLVEERFNLVCKGGFRPIYYKD